MVFRLLIVIHRWLGVALCVLFLLWFPSGIGMMYWGMPSVTAQDRLDHMPTLDPARIKVSAEEAAATIGRSPSRNQIRLTSFDGRPAYRFAGEDRIVYADTGGEHRTADQALRDRAVSQWT